MCTLTYLPLEKAQNFLLTSSRDEGYLRKAALPPQLQERKYAKILSPVDADACGTWFVTGDNGLSCCLLNGAFDLHERKLPYRKSRGILVLEIFDYPSVEAFLREYDLDNIEPFTLNFFDASSGEMEITELRWDGQEKHVRRLSGDEPHIWSSATLYTKEMREIRQKWFREWLAKKPAFTRESALDFHLNGGNGDPNVSFKMDRAGLVHTVSVTSLEHKSPHRINMQYHDLVNEQVAEGELELN